MIKKTEVVASHDYSTEHKKSESNISYSGEFLGQNWELIHSDALQGLQAMQEASVNCIVTSPPYYWQRDYDVDGQIGHEDSIAGYVDALTAVFREAKRVLDPTGTFFLNIGDTFYSAKGQPHGSDKKHKGRKFSRQKLRAVDGPGLGLPRKSLIGIPWRVALSLQQDGWTLRSSIIWKRSAPIPEPTAKDRPWRSYEHIFLFSKSPRYWFDRTGMEGEEDVWEINARPENPGSHFAPYPRELVKRCITCGCPKGGTILDPFVGSGTTMLESLACGYSALGIELNKEYCDLTAKRILKETRQYDLQGDLFEKVIVPK
jgi:DNA modification methylase